MKTLLRMANVGLLLVTGNCSPSGAGEVGAESTPLAAPIEYVLPQQGEAVPRSAWEAEFPERIERRGTPAQPDRRITGIKIPSVTLMLPAGKPTAACLVCPGGAYGALSFDKEGLVIGQWLRQRGIAAGVLKYPVAGKHDQPLISWEVQPLDAAHAAIRLLKVQLEVPVGVIGFSAGGHLAATVANDVRDPEKSASPRLQVDTQLAFHALLYPVITLEDGKTHRGSRLKLLGDNATQQQLEHWSMERRVTTTTSPGFVVATVDDRVVPAINSTQYANACIAKGVPVELHLFEKGGHGYGMWTKDRRLSTWPALFDEWLTTRGFIR